MIKSCESIKTLDEFEELMESRANALRMGLEETARMVCWDERNLVCPEFFVALLEQDIVR
ncbi:hypothetical protein LCGC14_1445690 [marine sediment metagenome]|uniref:Uncharacterized protein n=1 Tax=marine sediment metagenome TaxID=412755 RepID=A0A0F9JK04_9ZZZZ